jgi:uncharacterized protein
MKKLTTKIAAAVLAGAVVATTAGAALTRGSSPAAAEAPTTVAVAASGPQSSARPHTSAGRSTRGSDRTVRVEPAMTSTTTSGVVDTRLIHRPGQAIPGADTGRWASWDDFMSFVVQDTASVWNWYYRQWGRGVSSVHYLFPAPGQSYRTACGDVTNDTTMEYCSYDDTIYFSKALAASLWTGYTGWGGKNIGGDFAVVTMLAHEYGHNVQQELNQGGLPLLKAIHGVPNVEQQADCYSGAFARVAGAQGILDPNDINEGMWTIYAVGDYLDRADHHGTPAERLTAWKTGYYAANGPAACDPILTK